LEKEKQLQQRLADEVDKAIPSLKETTNATAQLSTSSRAGKRIVMSMIYSPTRWSIPEKTIHRYEAPLQDLSDKYSLLEESAHAVIDQESTMLRKFSKEVTEAIQNDDGTQLQDAVDTMNDGLQEFQKHVQELFEQHEIIRSNVSALSDQASSDEASLRRKGDKEEGEFKRAVGILSQGWFSRSSFELQKLTTEEEIKKAKLKAEAEYILTIKQGLEMILDALRERAKQYRHLLNSITSLLDIVSDKDHFVNISSRVLKRLTDEFCQMGFEMTKFISTERVARIMWPELAN